VALRAALKAAVIASTALFLMIILLPIAAIFLSVTPSELLSRLTTPTVLDSLRLSLLASTVATAIILVLATPLSYLLARHRFRGKWFIDAIVDLPMVLPPAVAGLALLLAFAPRGIIGSILRSYGIILPGSFWAVVLAEVFVGSPFYIRSSKAAFAEVNQRLIDSARLLSPSDARVFVKVTLPIAWRGVLAGLIMCWARSLGEFGATLMFAGNLPNVTQTMPLAIYLAMSSDLEAAIVLSTILVIFSFGLLAAFKAIGGQRNP
jgi:molybdate transport system permease protein